MWSSEVSEKIMEAQYIMEALTSDAAVHNRKPCFLPTTPRSSENMCQPN